jgi:hypothetical protein
MVTLSWNAQQLVVSAAISDLNAGFQIAAADDATQRADQTMIRQ